MDKQLHDSDKFQYLVQSLESEAKIMVERYPQSAENYPLAIAALKDRFANPKLLRKVYIRELQKLVISNVKSKVQLGEMYYKLDTQLRSLEALGNTTDSSEFLYPIVESSLPEETLIAWQRSPEYSGGEEKSDLKRLMAFLHREVEAEQQRVLARTGYFQKEDRSKPKPKFTGKVKITDVPTAASLYSGDMGCIFCGGRHISQECIRARTMSLSDKEAKVREANVCFICLKKGHRSSHCKQFVKCFKCNKKHFTIMCRGDNNTSSTNSKSVKEDVHTAASNMVTQKTDSTLTNSHHGGTVLLCTIKVRVCGPSGSREVRALIDGGSQRSYIKTSLAQQLSCPVRETIIQRNEVFGGVITQPKEKKVYIVNVASCQSRYRKNLFLVGENVICNSCPVIPKGPWLQELQEKGIKLSDLGAKNTEVDILIGMDLIPIIQTGRGMRIKPNLLAEETVYGWILGGKLRGVDDKSVATLSISLLVNDNQSITDMWNLDTLGIKDSACQVSQENHNAEVKEKFQAELQQDAEGRYCVKLPWVSKDIQLPTNKVIAERRLAKVTEKLKRENAFANYNQVFENWEAEDMIEVVSSREEDGHYLPHRPVFKPESLTTPIRPVFDASCKIGNNPSLNQCLEKGPNLLELIPSVLLRFREREVGVISDIRKAFQMISVDQNDRKYQRFLWWESEKCENLKVYQHKRVVFGMSSSPFMLAAVLEHHLDNSNLEDLSVASKLKKSLYVDNCAISFDSCEDYAEFKTKSVRLLSAAKMELRCWESNVEYSGQENTTILGLTWNKKEDFLCVKVPTVTFDNNVVTKRSVLSLISKIYDPIGITCPAILQPKLLIQESWCSDFDWDKSWEGEQRQNFINWASEIETLSNVKIPRCAYLNPISKVQLHTFVDASQSVYAAVVFSRVETAQGIIVSLLAAKSRLAPVPKKKLVTIPRLELLGCVIGSRLANSVVKSLDLQEVAKFYWTDSATALAWIKRQADWGTFVGNRTREISGLTNIKDWRHVPGELNPADLPSRGCSPTKLLESKWWEGPLWLYNGPSSWPNMEIEEDEEEITAEIKKTPVKVNVAMEVSQPVFSNFQSNVRLYGFVCRFLSNCRKAKRDRIYSQHLQEEERIKGESALLRLIQNNLDPKKLSQFKIERDGEGLLRVKTKLTNRPDMEDFKFPILLPSEDLYVHQLIRSTHEKYCHAGAQFVLCNLREKYWIIRGRKTVTRVIQGCIICRRYSAKKFVGASAPLPKARVQGNYVFETTGVDLAGPLVLKGGYKAWIVIYTCAVYRCVYLDVVDSISAEEFLQSLERFTWTCGRPNLIYSDNGTNFVGAHNLMEELDWETVTRLSGVRAIKWRFNPPTASWWGGWWERLVRSTKDLLRRMIGRAKLTRKELVHCLCAISYTMNNRPLTTLTEDVQDLRPLTPAMFLRDLPVSGLPEFEEIGAAEVRKAFKRIKALKEALQSRFRKEYLGQLVQQASEEKRRTVEIGDLVLVGADNKKRFEWPIGRVVELLPGKDGETRLVRVKTSTGIFLRPIQRLFPLEMIEKKVEVRARIEDKSVEDDAEDSEESAREKQPNVTRYGRTVRSPVRYTNWHY